MPLPMYGDLSCSYYRRKSFSHGIYISRLTLRMVQGCLASVHIYHDILSFFFFFPHRIANACASQLCWMFTVCQMGKKSNIPLRYVQFSHRRAYFVDFVKVVLIFPLKTWVIAPDKTLFSTKKEDIYISFTLLFWSYYCICVYSVYVFDLIKYRLKKKKKKHQSFNTFLIFPLKRDGRRF